MPRLRQLSFALLFSSALLAQNVNIAGYPQYINELTAFQKAFNGGAPDRGESVAAQGAAAARAAQDRSGEAHWTRLTGATFQIRGDFRAARGYYERSLAIRRELNQAPDILLLTSGLGFVCLTTREFDDARRYLQEAVRIAAELQQPADEGRASYTLGQVERAQQRYPEAASALDSAIRKYGETGPAGPPAIGLARIELARVNLDRTQYPAALREGLEAVRVLSRLPRRESDTAAALDVVGTVFHFLEDPRKALGYYRQAFELRTKAKVRDLTESYRNIGVELDQLGSHAEAIEYLDKVVSARRAGGAKAELAGAMINLAVGQQESGNPVEARRNFNEALELLPDDRAALRQRAIALYGLGNLDIAEGKIAGALSRHREALRLRRETGDARGALRSLNRIGIALEKASRWKEALAVHREATDAFETMLAGIADPVQAVAFRATSAILYPHYARVLLELGQPGEALMTAERGRGTGLNRIAALSGEEPRIAEAARRAAAARNRLRLAFERGAEREEEEVAFLEASRELSRLRDGSAAARKALAGRVERPPVEQILALARRQPGTLFLEWLEVDEDLTLLFAVSARHGIEVHRLPKSVKAMGVLLDEWYRTLSRGQSARVIKLPAEAVAPGADAEPVLARRVNDMLFGDAAARLGSFSRLVLVTDGALLRTPFPALMDAQERRLIDRFSLSTAVSLTSLLHPAAAATRSPRVFAIGDPVEAGSQASVVPQALHLAPLAGAREEAVAIARLLPGSATSVGLEAREAAVKKQLPGYDIVHFATHGILDLGEPLHSSLLLAAEPADSGEDGLLEAWEIASLKLNTRLAVLSACETGQGQETLSDGILGLSWAFQAAGCPNVMASLWSVDDAATRAMMIGFYEQIRVGARIDDAMRMAIQKVRGEKAFQSPYYWAAFQIIGPAGSLMKR